MSASTTATTTSSQTSVPSLRLQIASLNVLIKGFIGILRHNNTTTSSSNAEAQVSSSDLELFLDKLAQIVDCEKGGDTISSLVCLKNSKENPEYVLFSNNRSDGDCATAEKYLSELLNYISLNPEQLAQKPIQKRVLWRILLFNSPRVTSYLNAFSTALAGCLKACDPNHQKHLLLLEERCKFDFNLPNIELNRPKYFKDCESLIAAILNAKNTGLNAVYKSLEYHDNLVVRSHAADLRHYVGRLYSYRQAAEAIVNAFEKRPDLFVNATVTVKPSAPRKKSLVKKTVTMEQLLENAFVDVDPADYSEFIEELESLGLRTEIDKLLKNLHKKAPVHCEIQVHRYLVEVGKTQSQDFWDNKQYIATSKPPCRLCHFYFDTDDSGFRLQQSHMNVYERWRFPDFPDTDGKDDDDDDDDELNELLEDFTDRLKEHALEIVATKTTPYRNHDSKTDTYSAFRSHRPTSLPTPTPSIPDDSYSGASLRSSSSISQDEENWEEIGTAK